MVNLRGWSRRSTLIIVASVSSVMAGDAPPATLPRGFLEQLPVLLELDEQEFELLLNHNAWQTLQVHNKSRDLEPGNDVAETMQDKTETQTGEIKSE